MSSTYFAHSGTPDDFRDWQPLAEHLRDVGDLAKKMALQTLPAEIALADAAYCAGFIHDLGKYRPEFQQYLRNLLAKGNPLTFHKQAGAAKALFHWKHSPIAMAVMGHHGGIPDGSTLNGDLKLQGGRPTAEAIWQSAIQDCPELADLSPGLPNLQDAFHADIFTRVLFSCLVDADWTNTGENDRKCKGLPVEPDPPKLNPAVRLAGVLAFINTRASQCKEEQIKRIRGQILDVCLARAEAFPGLFSLTVPTGGGKTLAGLAFALKHAAKHSLRRVIYVAPYMSILEQNIGVFREALGIGPDATDLFEHYSLAELAGPAHPTREQTEKSCLKVLDIRSERD